MEKQTKNIITREWIENELRFNNTADIRRALVICGVSSIFSVPLTVGVVLSEFGYVWNIFYSVFASAPIWIGFLVMIECLMERRSLNRGEFVITVCEVESKDELYVRRHIEEVLRFHGFQYFSVGHTMFQLTSSGDLFYLVHYKDSTTIKQLYPLKMYELREG